VEAFGPVSTLMPYEDITDAVALANRGLGSLVLSLFTNDPDAAETFVLGAGAYHGRMMIIDRSSAKESTGHGSPLPSWFTWRPRPRRPAARQLGGCARHPLYAAHRAPGGPGALVEDRQANAARRRQPGVRFTPFRKRMPSSHRLHTGTASRIGHAEEDVSNSRNSPATPYNATCDEAAKSSPIL
jgi:oxepin-CoA hydrolase/3-oxo-5,6-dehydrosuberyl-CoA semialdehyde dehydrogenase